MTRVLLIRHGETHWNRDRRWQGQANIELSEEGRSQAARLAASLAKLEPSLQVIYSSDLCRAHDTARELAAAIGTGIFVDPHGEKSPSVRGRGCAGMRSRSVS